MNTFLVIYVGIGLTAIYLMHKINENLKNNNNTNKETLIKMSEANEMLTQIEETLGNIESAVREEGAEVKTQLDELNEEIRRLREENVDVSRLENIHARLTGINQNVENILTRETAPDLSPPSETDETIGSVMSEPIQATEVHSETAGTGEATNADTGEVTAPGEALPNASEPIGIDSDGEPFTKEDLDNSTVSEIKDEE